MDLSVDYNNVSSRQEAFEIAKQEITEDYVAKFKVKADISFDEANHIVIAKGKGFEMKLTFLEDHCELDLKLGLLLKALRSSVLDIFKKKLNKHL